MKFRWSVAPPQPALAAELAAGLQVPLLLAQCLLNRQIDSLEPARRFLEPRLRQLSDPFLIPGMERAVERLLAAHARKESVVIFGDYDVDGVTSTALLLELLTTLGWRVGWYLPRRFDEGYGLSPEAVGNCLEKAPVDLLLAVDCGSSSAQCVAALRQRGVDVIVLDHHQPCWPLPDAHALVNPLATTPTANGTAPRFAELCSAGLAFKLAHALVKRGRAQGLPGAESYNLKPLLELAVLGTIADVVPLTGENRILASVGLTWLNQSRRPGLGALRQVAQCPDSLGPREVGFLLAPRLNAAGRLETAEQALSLLRETDPALAHGLAAGLDSCNRERQKLERAITEQALTQARTRFNPETDYVVVESQPDWHIGVVGIVASRVCREFHRPAVILGGDGEGLRGSGRSIEGFDLAGALRECDSLLTRCGGHAMAAGVSLPRHQLEPFRRQLNEVARRRLRPEDLQPRLRLDAEVALADVDFRCLEALGRLKPCGPGNPAVHLVARGLRHVRPPRRIGAGGKHLKLKVTDGRAVAEAVWWDAGPAVPEAKFDLAFAPVLNEYQGTVAVQLQVLDWRPAAA